VDHEYLQGKTASQSQLCRFFSKRLAASNPEQEKTRLKMVAPKGKVFMSNEEQTEKMPDPTVILEEMGDFEKSGKKMDVLYSEAHPTILMKVLQETLETLSVTPIVNDDKWCVSYQVPMKNMQQPDEEEKDEDYQPEIKLNVKIDF